MAKMRKEKIFITGGAGYAGSCLVPELLKKGYEVTVYDIMYYTDRFLPKTNSNLQIIKGDIRDSKKILETAKGHDVFVHLACISNDTSFALDEKLSTSINLDSFEPMVKSAKDAGIKRFIYASSSSVYGISDKKNVTEDHPLVPLTLYNKYKGMCEPILFNYTDQNFEGVIFRPATVCGYAPRQRLDLSVNILTNFAINKGMIKVFGGDQLRPNIHIKDMVRSYIHVIESDFDFEKENIFNVGYNNFKVIDIAEKVKNVIGDDVTIERVPTNDNRSYHVSSEKIKKVLNFQNEFNLDDAISDLKNAFSSKVLKDSLENKIYFNIKMMQSIKLK